MAIGTVAAPPNTTILAKLGQQCSIVLSWIKPQLSFSGQCSITQTLDYLKAVRETELASLYLLAELAVASVTLVGATRETARKALAPRERRTAPSIVTSAGLSFSLWPTCRREQMVKDHFRHLHTISQNGCEHRELGWLACCFIFQPRERTEVGLCCLTDPAVPAPQTPVIGRI